MPGDPNPNVPSGASEQPFAPPATWPLPDQEVWQALQGAWSDGSWGRYDGPHSARLGGLLAEMHGVSHVLLCSSGTIAVELALRGLQIAAGDEVILAGYDFSGNFRAVEAVSARPVLVDIASHHWCLDAERVAEAITSQTRAILVSHLHGTLADMKQLSDIARGHGLAIVEDACQVPGGRVQGRIAGSWGDVGVLSFGGSKLLTAGRGGAVLMNRADVFQRIKIYAERGNLAFPLSELQAAVLAPQIARLDARNAQRQASVERLLARLPNDGPLRPLVDRTPGNVASFYKLGFLYDASRCNGRTREEFIAGAQAAGVPLDSGFLGFVRRSNSRCRTLGNLESSRRAAKNTVLLHHPILLESPPVIDQLAAIIERAASPLGMDGSWGPTNAG